MWFGYVVLYFLFWIFIFVGKLGNFLKYYDNCILKL